MADDRDILVKNVVQPSLSYLNDVDDEFAKVSYEVLYLLCKEFPNMLFPSYFRDYFLDDLIVLLKSLEKRQAVFSSEALYCLVTVLSWELPDLSNYDYRLFVRFSNLRANLDGVAAQSLVRQELRLIEERVERVKRGANYKDIEDYLDNVGLYATRLKEIGDLNIEVNNLKDALEKYKIGFNFVGLYKGFSDLRRRKSLEKNLRIFLLFLIGGAALAPFFIKLFLAWGNKNLTPEVVIQSDFMEKLMSFVNSADVGLFLTFLGFEFLLLYYFRIILHSLKSIRGQLLQIDLRMTLCQFVQDYAKYSSKVKSEGGSLERFESIIFSGLVTVEESIPSTFDGFDSVSELIRRVTNK